MVQRGERSEMETRGFGFHSHLLKRKSFFVLNLNLSLGHVVTSRIFMNSQLVAEIVYCCIFIDHEFFNKGAGLH